MTKRLRKTLPKERLSPSEWQIMRICWRLGRCTVREVLQEDLKTQERDYRTILTFMTRMARKGWLRAERRGNMNHYDIAVPRDMAFETEVCRFLDDFVEQEPDGLETLQRLLVARSK